MKKLIINGCSFTAGDALTWQTHFPDIDWYTHILEKKLHHKYMAKELDRFYTGYIKNLRPLDSLSGQLKHLFNTEVIDISSDGNSNGSISMSTILYLESIPREERKNYHVCVGWTEFTRRVRWSEKIGKFLNINHAHITDKRYAEYETFIKEIVVSSAPPDHWFDYLANLIQLELYLKSNDVTYTFWRSLGEHINPFNAVLPGHFIDENIFNLNKISSAFDASNWISFGGSLDPWYGTPWIKTFKDTDFLTKKNHHPNLSTVIKFSKVVADKINQHFSITTK